MHGINTFISKYNTKRTRQPLACKTPAEAYFGAKQGRLLRVSMKRASLKPRPNGLLCNHRSVKVV